MRKLTPAEALSRLQEVHPDVEFPDFNYTSSNGFIKAVCPTHGAFQRRFDLLVRGRFCPLCGYARKGKSRLIPHSEAIQKMQSVRPDYDFTQFIYTNSTTKSIVLCPSHGAFLATYQGIIYGHGCPKCKGAANALRCSKSEAQAVAEMRLIAPQYSYENYEFKTVKTKGLVTCAKHGDFSATHSAIVRGRGCPSCGIEARGLKSRLSPETVIERMQGVFPAYDFSKFAYKGSSVLGTVVCPKHGDFRGRYPDLVRGVGCTKCTREAQSIKSRIPVAEFLQRVRLVHGTNMICRENTYLGVSSNVVMCCPTHGDFKILAGSLLAGQGCPDCKDSRFNPKKRAFLYLYKITHRDSNYLGFGITTNLPRRKEEHRVRFGGSQCSGEFLTAFRFARGYICRNVETLIKDLVEITPLPVRGFKKEACAWSNYREVIDLVQSLHTKYRSVTDLSTIISS